MTTKTIWFSHHYYKMGDSETAKLLAVFKTHYNELGKDFIEFDTAYNEVTHERGETIVCEAHYPLPKTDLLVLLFQDSDGLFTTIRRWTPQKETYYREAIGEQFQIVIEEEKK